MNYSNEDSDLYWESERPEYEIIKINIKNNRELEEDIDNFIQDYFSKLLNDDNNFEELERLGYDVDDLFLVNSFITPEKIEISITIPDTETFETSFEEVFNENFEDEYTSGEIISYTTDKWYDFMKNGGGVGAVDITDIRYTANVYLVVDSSPSNQHSGLIQKYREIVSNFRKSFPRMKVLTQFGYGDVREIRGNNIPIDMDGGFDLKSFIEWIKYDEERNEIKNSYVIILTDGHEDFNINFPKNTIILTTDEGKESIEKYFPNISVSIIPINELVFYTKGEGTSGKVIKASRGLSLSDDSYRVICSDTTKNKDFKGVNSDEEAFDYMRSLSPKDKLDCECIDLKYGHKIKERGENPEDIWLKNGGGVGNEKLDLFEYYEMQPKKLKSITNKWNNKYEDESLSYSDTKKYLKEVQSVGYTFDYGLDNMPYGLRPIGVKINELKGFENIEDEDDYKDGGGIGNSKHENGAVVSQDWYDFDVKMALINCDVIKEYAIKLDKIVGEDSNLEDWVKMKMTRIEQNMADVKKSLAGWEKFSEGGRIFKKQLLHIAKYADELIDMIQGGSKLMSWQENKLAVSAEYIDSIYHHLDYEMGNRAENMPVKANLGYVAIADAVSSRLPKATAVLDERVAQNLKSPMQRFKEYRESKKEKNMNTKRKYNDGGGVGEELESLLKKLSLFKKFAPNDPVAKNKYVLLDRILEIKTGMNYDQYMQSKMPVQEQVVEEVVEVSEPKMTRAEIYERIDELTDKVMSLSENVEDLNWDSGDYESESEQIYNRIEEYKQEINDLKLMLSEAIDESVIRGQFYGKFGKDNPRIISFNPDKLDEYERFFYNDMIKKHPKEQVIQLLINTVEGDYSQLSPELYRIAEEQKPSVEWSGEEPIMGIARHGGMTRRYMGKR